VQVINLKNAKALPGRDIAIVSWNVQTRIVAVQKRSDAARLKRPPPGDLWYRAKLN
jgi:hypothetical protein